MHTQRTGLRSRGEVNSRATEPSPLLALALMAFDHWYTTVTAESESEGEQLAATKTVISQGS